MFARILAIAIAVIVLSGCWRTVGAPIGLRLEQSGTGKNCKSPTKSTTSGAASPLFREVRGVDLERQIPPKVRSTKVMQAYVSKLDEVLQSKEAAPPLAGTAVTPKESRQFNAEATRLELTSNEFKDFLHAFDEEVLDLNTLSVPRNDVFTAKSNQKPGLMRLYRFYLIAYSHGKYVDRQGHIYDAPNLSKGIDNQVISNVIAIYLDSVADVKFGEAVLIDGKKYLPAGNSNKPSVLIAGDSKLVSVTKANIVKDPLECGLTKLEAKALAYIGTLAEQKAALASGIAAESLSGWDVSLVVGGRFAIGDNKTLAEIIKTFFSVTARRASQRAAYEFFKDFAYEENSVPELLIDIGIALGE